VPPAPEGATPEQKDAHWFKHVYQGDKMPQLTLRAVLTGGILGMLLAASNLYTTLHIGWSFGVAITASVISFVVWSIITPLIGCRKMSILETNCMASTASSAGYSTGSTIATMFGALVLLHFIPDHRQQQLAFEKAPTSGEFVLAFGEAAPTQTGPIPFNASAEVLRAELEALGGIDAGDVEVVAAKNGAWDLTFKGKLDDAEIGQIMVVRDTTDAKIKQDTTGRIDTSAMKTIDIHPAWLLASFTLLTGLMGVFLAIPMKRQMINHEQLPFPSGIAGAETLRSLYSESKEAIHKAYALILGLGLGAIVAVLRTGSGTFRFLDLVWERVGSVLPWMVEPKDPNDPSQGVNVVSGPIPDHVPHAGFARLTDEGKFTQGTGKEMIGFSLDTSLLLLAAGMIVGLRVSLSMLLGSIILYFWLGPMLVGMDKASATTENYVPSFDVLRGGTAVNFFRWGLWGGTSLMVMASLTTLALQWKTIARAFTLGKGEADASTGNAMRAIEVPFMWMVIGMAPITIGMVIIQVVAFNISWWAGLIAVAMSFVLSLVACRATGETDTTPVGAMGKVMQLLFALLHPGKVVPNLASAGIAANSASSSADLLTDLKIGYLLGANPRRQFLAQFWGVFFGTLAIVPIWYLMVPDKATLERLPAPATQTWAKVAEVLTKGLDFLPYSAQIAILIGAGVGVLLPLIERFVVPAKHRKYMPSATGLGLAFMLPFYNSLAFTLGAIISFVWSKVQMRTHQLYNIALASGVVAGESLISAFIAMLSTATGLAGWKL
jgi:uncharacterized oligopeptide transporter (OPT) family protein